ncbi:MAG TPA: TraR/DksA family transcriptional regulator [Thermoleophilia bacterium]|nr:TraR/DksA family transcriptional regulator [Thermoleophilia bacterium]
MDREQVREVLTEERERLVREIESLEGDPMESPTEVPEEIHPRLHMAENAAYTLDRQMELTLGENARHVLARIERALAKLESGSYGLCDSCGASIEAARLEAVPYAGFCIDCQRREERGA